MSYQRTIKIVGLAFVAGALAVSGQAATIATCSAAFVCQIPENTFLQFPAAFGFAISGDVVLLEADHVTVSDVFRIYNDVVNTGNGTGLGTTAFLFSSDDSTPLPAPSTYSANVTRIQESPSGYTIYAANGDTYILGAPEPATFGLLGLAFTLAAVLKRIERAA